MLQSGMVRLQDWLELTGRNARSSRRDAGPSSVWPEPASHQGCMSKRYSG
jgi:hypothetical protein